MTRQGTVEAQYKTLLLKELFRKSIHMCSAFIPLCLAFNYSLTLVLLAVALALYCASEACRRHGVDVPIVSRVTRAAARRRDEDAFVMGPVMLVAGIICTALLWSAEAAAIGIYALAFGDGLASLVGKSFGKVRIPFMRGKTVAGSLACFIAVYLSSFLVERNATASLLLAFAAMVTEMLPLGDMDNLVIPVVVAGLARVLLP